MGTDNSMAVESGRKTYVEVERTNILVKNLSTSMPSSLVNSIILVIVLWNVIPRSYLGIWCLTNIFFVLVRYIMIGYYRRGFQQDNYLLWQWVLLLSFIIAGLLFGSAGLFFINTDQLAYMVFLYFVMGGMVAGSLGSYHNNLAMFFSYSTMVFLIPTAVLFTLGTDMTTSMAILGLIFFVIMSINAKRMNTDLRIFLVLRYDNNLLVEQFNQEKLNTEKLNQKLVMKNNELKKISRIDPLTGLKNRHYLFDILKPKVENEIYSLWMKKNGSNKREPSDLSGYGVISIDIDHFKKVNDNYGHDSGDMVLKQFSARLCETVRQDDVIVRIGGEEFIIILKDTRESHLSTLAEKIRLHVENSTFKVTDNREISITCSLGFIYYPFFKHHPGNIRIDHIFYLVDKALYVAKENGRNLVVKVACSEGDSRDIPLLESITQDLGKAIDARQILFEF
ncbi:MAG: diguanylate cyclase [Desulfobacteraceae bacterium]|nr:diguanylate cyclase [Desulfobacteraceae bacterium]